MARHKVALPPLVLSTSAQAASNIVGGRELAMCVGLVFYNPAAFTGTISVEVAADENDTGSGMKALYNNGTAVTLNAGRVEKFDVAGFESLRIKTSGTEGAQRTVNVIAILDIPGS